MTTNQLKKMEREQAILKTLKLLEFATRSQLQSIHHLGTNRNASRVLNNMSQYLNSFLDKEYVYYLNKAGREMVGSNKVLTKSMNYQHTLMRNDIYIHFGMPTEWRNEYPIRSSKGNFITDAVFRVDGKHYFLEVDRCQKMKVNLQKLQSYFSFQETGLWQRSNNGEFPTLIFYTLTDTRKNQLQEVNPGLDLLTFTKKDLLL